MLGFPYISFYSWLTTEVVSSPHWGVQSEAFGHPCAERWAALRLWWRSHPGWMGPWAAWAGGGQRGNRISLGRALRLLFLIKPKKQAGDVYTDVLLHCSDDGPRLLRNKTSASCWAIAWACLTQKQQEDFKDVFVLLWRQTVWNVCNIMPRHWQHQGDPAALKTFCSSPDSPSTGYSLPMLYLSTIYCCLHLRSPLSTASQTPVTVSRGQQVFMQSWCSACMDFAVLANEETWSEKP